MGNLHAGTLNDRATETPHPNHHIQFHYCVTAYTILIAWLSNSSFYQ